MNHWLVKSEPESFSWDMQVEHGVEPWTGVRSHQAKNNLKAMALGDRAFFYHSNVGKEIVGIVEVVRTAYPDPTAEAAGETAGELAAEAGAKVGARAGGWVCVDMRAVRPFKHPVTLAAMKADPALEGLALLKYSRLSVAPVEPAFWRHICKLGGVPAT